MKQILLFITALFLSAGALAQNLVTNAGFEAWNNETRPTDWSKAESVTQETTIIRSGTYSAKHTGGTKALGQYVTLTGGKTYTVSIWYYTVENDGTDSRIWAKWADADKTLFDNEATEAQLEGPNNKYFPTFGEWAEYSTTVAAPASAAFLYLEVRTYSGAITYWDDFSVTEENATKINQQKAGLVTVYPNPFYSEFSIEGAEIASVELINLAGQLVLQAEGNNLDKVVIPTITIAKGVYMLKITDVNGKVLTKKVIKK